MDGSSSICPIMQAIYVATFDNILTTKDINLLVPAMQKLPYCTSCRRSEHSPSTKMVIQDQHLYIYIKLKSHLSVCLSVCIPLEFIIKKSNLMK